METYTLRTALRKAKEGIFEFQEDCKPGVCWVKYQTPSGKWKSKPIHILRDRSQDV